MTPRGRNVTDGVLVVGDKVMARGHLAVVRYIGPLADKAGVWLGLELDDPVGKV